MAQEYRLQVGSRDIVVRVRERDALKPNPYNSNRGQERGNTAVRTSIRETGLHRGIVVSDDDTVIAGNHAYQAAVEEGVAEAWIEVELPDGSVGVITKRSDWRSSRDANAIKAANYDNRSQELNYDPDPVQFAQDLEAITKECEAIAPALFTEAEILEIIEAAGSELLDQFEGEDMDAEGDHTEFECPQCGHKW